MQYTEEKRMQYVDEEEEEYEPPRPTLVRQLFEMTAYVLCVTVCCCADRLQKDAEPLMPKTEAVMQNQNTQALPKH